MRYAFQIGETNMRLKATVQLYIACIFSVIALASSPVSAASPKSCRFQLHSLSREQVYSLSIDELENMVREVVLKDCPFSLVDQAFSGQLTLLDICSIHSYTTTAFARINKGLWLSSSSADKLNGEDWAYIRMLDRALDKIPAQEPTVVYRGTQRKHIKFTEPGQLVELKGYTSTTPEQEIAEGFLNGEDENNYRLMVIQVRSAKDITRLAGVAEKELLLKRGTWVRFERSEIKEINVFREDSGETERRKVEFVFLTEVSPIN